MKETISPTTFCCAEDHPLDVLTSWRIALERESSECRSHSEFFLLEHRNLHSFDTKLNEVWNDSGIMHDSLTWLSSVCFSSHQFRRLDTISLEFSRTWETNTSLGPPAQKSDKSNCRNSICSHQKVGKSIIKNLLSSLITDIKGMRKKKSSRIPLSHVNFIVEHTTLSLSPFSVCNKKWNFILIHLTHTTCSAISLRRSAIRYTLCVLFRSK